MPVPKRLRFEILRRDNHACRYCGATAPTATLTVDHVIPEVLGGTNEPSNLVTACEPCNSGKSSVQPDAPLVADVAADTFRWAEAVKVAAVYSEMERERRDKTRDAFLAAWNNWGYHRMDTGAQVPYALPNDWSISIDRFTVAGLRPGDIADAVDQTMRSSKVNDRWRFFCGIGWRMVRDLHTIARQVIALEDGE